MCSISGLRGQKKNLENYRSEIFQSMVLGIEKKMHFRGLIKHFCSKLQEISPEVERRIQWQKLRGCDTEDEDNSLNNFDSGLFV